MSNMYITYDSTSKKIHQIILGSDLPIVDNLNGLSEPYKLLNIDSDTVELDRDKLQNYLVIDSNIINFGDAPGEYYLLTPNGWVEDIPYKLNSLIAINRGKRNSLLSEIDIIATNPLRWAEVPDKEAVAVYRQALLDVPQQAGFPENINWPVKPEGI